MAPQWVADVHGSAQQLWRQQDAAGNAVGKPSVSAHIHLAPSSLQGSGDGVQLWLQCLGSVSGLMLNAPALRLLPTPNISLSGPAPGPDFPLVGYGMDPIGCMYNTADTSNLLEELLETDADWVSPAKPSHEKDGLYLNDADLAHWDGFQQSAPKDTNQQGALVPLSLSPKSSDTCANLSNGADENCLDQPLPCASEMEARHNMLDLAEDFWEGLKKYRT